MAEEKVSIDGEAGIVAARQRARELARSLGFGAVDQSRITTAVSELARNVVQYAGAGQGTLVLRPITGPNGRSGIEIVVSDDGPGIASVEQVMQEGFSTGRGLGLGLPGTKRLMDEMEIDSAIGRGTVIVVRKWRR